jgi:transglutaminase-like putative cysteine protease
MSSSPQSNDPRGPLPKPLPWPLTAAALTAFTALFLTSYPFPGVWLLPFCGVLLLATHFTRFRVPRASLYRYGLRFVAVTLILLVHGIPAASTARWYFEPEYTRLAGSILAAELVIRAWLQPNPARVAREGGMCLLITALLMLAASNTYDRPPIHTLAPVYTLFVALTLRALSIDPSRTAPRRAPGRRSLLVLRGAALLFALGFGAVTVALVTKYDNRLTAWAVNYLQQRTRTPNRPSAIGLGLAPQLGPIFNPEASLDRALLIDGPPADRHLRVLAFDSYENSVWRPGLTQRTFQRTGRHLAATSRPTTAAPTQSLEITRLGDTADILPLPDNAVLLRAESDVETEPQGAVRSQVPGANPAYHVTVAAVPDTIPLAAPPLPGQRKRLLNIPPEIDARIPALARSVAGGSAAPAQRLFRIQQHLRAHHTYSLTFTPAAGTDPLNDFVLNDRAAHCQYFASAMVMMARAAGVPARMVTGYYAHEPYGPDRTVVRERDAHAWAECYLDDVGQWVTVDATPATGRPDGLFPDPPAWRRWLERLRDLPGQVRDWISTLPRSAAIALLTVAAALLLLIPIVRTLLARRRTRSTLARDSYPTPAPELLEAARRFDRWLRVQNVPIPPTRTWREHAQRLTQTNTHIEDFLNTYDAARFGAPTSKLLPRLQSLLAQLEQSPPSSTMDN